MILDFAIKSFASRQFVLFLVTGGIAAAVNFFSRIVYSHWLDYSSAVIVAYLSGMITAFILARLFVFTQSGQHLRQSAVRFTLVNAVAIAQTWIISMALFYWVLPGLGIDRFAAELAHVVGVMVPAFTSYLGHKHWSFRE
ncbi:MAG: putative flippase GtrA [Gammaproteobacteria bacterium]|jgi:putative flippase GtrA